jgi:RES domain-containing protein
MIDAISRLFQHPLSEVEGRPERGRWIRAMPAVRVPELLDADRNRLRGGRLNPPGSFQVLYAAEDELSLRERIVECLSGSPTTIVTVFDADLFRVLDLSDPRVRRQIGVTVGELWTGGEPSLMQALGVAARNEGFEGVVYPRPWRLRSRNIAIFTDRIDAERIRLVEVLPIGGES